MMKPSPTMKPLRPLLGLALAALPLFPGAGCQAYPSRGNAQNTFVGSEHDDEVEEYFGDRRLAGQFELVGMITERRDDRLHVQFDLHNRTNSNLSVEWALEWRDAKGFRIDAPANWRPLQIGGRGYQTVSATAPVPAATEFQLGVRKPSPID